MRGEGMVVAPRRLAQLHPQDLDRAAGATGGHSAPRLRIWTTNAGIASELLERPVRRQILPDEVLRAQMAARGALERAADMVLGLYVASRNGEFATVGPTLERLLGRRPISMRDLMAQKVVS